MSALQNRTNQNPRNDGSDFVAVPWSELSIIQQTIVDYKALNGLVTRDTPNAEGKTIYKMTVETLAHSLGISRQTFYDHINAIPNFWDLVAIRRKLLGSQSRLARVHDAWYLKAVKGDFQHLQLYLANFDPDFRMPQQQVKHEAGGGLTDLLELARQRHRETEQIPEGEIVKKDANQNSNA